MIINTNRLPAGATVRRIRGDWMVNGYIDNTNRTRTLECVEMGGQFFAVDHLGRADLSDPLIVADGELQFGGWKLAFSPDQPLA